MSQYQSRLFTTFPRAFRRRPSYMQAVTRNLSFFFPGFSSFPLAYTCTIAYTIHTMYKMEFFFSLRSPSPSISYVSQATEHRKNVASPYLPTFFSLSKGFCAKRELRDQSPQRLILHYRQQVDNWPQMSSMALRKPHSVDKRERYEFFVKQYAYFVLTQMPIGVVR